jgi:hypothetical protein
MNNWKEQIVIGVLIQQRIEELDQGHLWTRYLPEAAATETELASAERTIGTELDGRYRAFLLHANGWRSFYQTVDLFGTPQLVGASPGATAAAQLRAIERDAFAAAAGADVSDWLAIGGSAVQRDMFLLGATGSPKAGSVLWHSGTVIEAFDDFDDFYRAMLDYNRREVTYLEQEMRSR